MTRRRHASSFVAGLILLGFLAGWTQTARADFRYARMGARPKALGSAFVSLADDANAAYWNPAGLVRDSRVSLMLTNSWMYGISDLTNTYLAMALPRLGAFHFGASWVRLGIKDIYYEDTINLAVAGNMPFLEGLSLGVAGKMFLLAAPGYEQYNDPSYNGGDQDFSFDLGLLYDSGGPWSLGATFYNVIQPKLQLLESTSSPDPVFAEWAAGGSYLFRETLLVTADFRTREGEFNNIVLNGGAEIWFYNALALRTGLEHGLVTIGAGLQDKHWQADFSLETDKNLGNIYMLSFTVRN
jgi:hypothetical protein